MWWHLSKLFFSLTIVPLILENILISAISTDKESISESWVIEMLSHIFVRGYCILYFCTLRKVSLFLKVYETNNTD